MNLFQLSWRHLSRQHLSWQHLYISGISQLLLTQFWPNFRGRLASLSQVQGKVEVRSRHSRAQHRIIEVSQIFVGSVLAMEMSVKYLKVTISFTKKSVKFSSVFILPQECQLFLGFRQYERKTVKFTARLAWTTIFNKIRQVFSFRSCHLPRLCSSQGQISYKKALEP